MVDWTPEAIEAAECARERVLDTDEEGDIYAKAMRAALDAAVKAQGIHDTISRAIDRGRILGRAEAFEEAAAYVEGKGGVIPGASVFASLVSRNNQPCMSGDPRDRLHRLDRRAFDDAMSWLAAAIRNLAKEPPK